MKDFFGQELNINDEVVFPRNSRLKMGKIVKIEEEVIVRFGGFYTRKLPSLLIRIKSQYNNHSHADIAGVLHRENDYFVLAEGGDFKIAKIENLHQFIRVPNGYTVFCSSVLNVQRLSEIYPEAFL